MNPKPFLSLLLFLAIFCPVYAQDPLNIDTTHRCLYSGTYFIDIFAFSDQDPTVEQWVSEICTAMKVDKGRIMLRNAIVPNAAAVIVGKEKYLLYNQSFFDDNHANPTLCRAILAHELGHLFAENHKLNDKFRVREELAADAFMGESLMRTDTAMKVENVLETLKKEPFSYAARIPWEEREEAIRRGWRTAVALTKGNGLGNNPEDVENLPLNRFRVTGCPKNAIVDNPRFVNKKLAEVDECLRKALSSKGYTECSYYSVKNGYALVTGLEQFQDNGLPAPGESRYQDCPSKEQFTGVYDYITKFLWPEPVRMRLFVFIVNDQSSMDYVPGCLKDGEPKQWLLSGGSWLPESIGALTFSKNYKVRVLAYEFTVPKSTKKASEQCERPLAINIHLDKSGLMAAIKACR